MANKDYCNNYALHNNTVLAWASCSEVYKVLKLQLRGQRA